MTVLVISKHNIKMIQFYTLLFSMKVEGLFQVDLFPVDKQYVKFYFR